MTIRTCLRCDWQGETEEPGCPNCGRRPLYVVGAPPSSGTEMPRVGPARSSRPPSESDPSPDPTDAKDPPRSSARSVAIFILTALVLSVTLGTWLDAPDPPSPTPPISRHGVTVGGVRFSIELPSGWERFGRISVNKSDDAAGDGQDAEAIIFWSNYPEGDVADPCRNLRTNGPAAAALADAVATAPGTKLVSAPSFVLVGQHPATHMVLTVREDLGCDPGFFYSWDARFSGAFWMATAPGDTISVWIVEVDGKRIFIEAEMREASPGLEQEIQDIIGSIRFD